MLKRTQADHHRTLAQLHADAAQRSDQLQSELHEAHSQAQEQSVHSQAQIAQLKVSLRSLCLSLNLHTDRG